MPAPTSPPPTSSRPSGAGHDLRELEERPVRLLAIADTHVPRRAKDLPAPVWAAVEAADLVVHAGDWTDEPTLDALAARARALVGVAGNNDGPGLHTRLPEVARVRAGGVGLVVVHETGAAPGRERRCAQRFPDGDLLVFGHSHIPWDTLARRGDGSTLRLLNPGSPTDRRRQPHATYLTALLEGGEVAEVALHRLP